MLYKLNFIWSLCSRSAPVFHTTDRWATNCGILFSIIVSVTSSLKLYCWHKNLTHIKKLKQVSITFKHIFKQMNKWQILVYLRFRKVPTPVEKRIVYSAVELPPILLQQQSSWFQNIESNCGQSVLFESQFVGGTEVKAKAPTLNQQQSVRPVTVGTIVPTPT